MNRTLYAPNGMRSGQSLQISGSKSESNRLLILRALFPKLRLENLGNADDVQAMETGLNSSEEIIDIGHAGTTMRFLTAYFASVPNRTVTLTGSARMQERPIGILVDALRQLGADISYLKNEGYPPLMIRGTDLSGSEIHIPAQISSQYISALLLIAAHLPEGLHLKLEGMITSRPYIEMTLALMGRLGLISSFKDAVIHIPPQQMKQPVTLTVESDWSSASYHFSLIALSDPGTTVRLHSFYEDSLQGDKAVVAMYESLGVVTRFIENGIELHKADREIPAHIEMDLKETPDLAQTLAVTCFGLGMACHLSGLHTLKIKETDRLRALKVELEKLGGQVHITDKALTLEPAAEIREGVTIETYHDHRMAMAFAPLALKVPITIADAEVVRKSYPNFWEHLDTLGLMPGSA